MTVTPRKVGLQLRSTADPEKRHQLVRDDLASDRREQTFGRNSTSWMPVSSLPLAADPCPLGAGWKSKRANHLPAGCPAA